MSDDCNLSPDSSNFLLPTKALFVLNRAPTLTFMIQRITFPQLMLPNAQAYPTPFSDIKIPGDKISFSALSIAFKVNENMSNYREIQNWMYGLGFPNNFQQFAALAGNAVDPGIPEQVLSDGKLLILDNNSRPNITVNFVGLNPTSLGITDFDVTDQNQTPVEGTATFEFTYFTIE